MKQRVFTWIWRVAIVGALTITVGSCGEVPAFRWNFGKPVSFAFSDAGIERIEQSTVVSARTVGARGIAKQDHWEYGDVIIQEPLTSGVIQTQREQRGVRLSVHTPDVFRIPMVKVGFLSTQHSDGFWVLLTSEGIGTGDLEYVDFTNPVYVTRNLLWDAIHYDILFSGFELGVSDIGGNAFVADIQVVIPGYTSTEIPDKFLWSGSIGPGEEFRPEEIKGHVRKYLGNNRFALTSQELYQTGGVRDVNGDANPFDPALNLFRYAPSMLLFRDHISTASVLAVSNVRWDLTGNERNAFAERWRSALYNDNEWERRQSFGPGFPEGWVDLPFDGLTVSDAATELIITVRWDLEDLIELWDFGDDGLWLLIAADFMERFTVDVDQIVR